MKSSVASPLSQKQGWRSLVAIALDWAVIGLCFAAAMRFSNAIVILIAMPVIARTQLALAVMMHESAHGLLLEHRRANDAIGQWFTAGPLFLSLYAYRQSHLQHHLEHPTGRR